MSDAVIADRIQFAFTVMCGTCKTCQRGIGRKGTSRLRNPGKFWDRFGLIE